uniref:Uncharacterized protein n=1 Tax=Arundo donax TaxID=35708 RepID=A0A0A8XZH5_ARUDO
MFTAGRAHRISNNTPKAYTSDF